MFFFQNAFSPRPTKLYHVQPSRYTIECTLYSVLIKLHADKLHLNTQVCMRRERLLDDYPPCPPHSTVCSLLDGRWCKKCPRQKRDATMRTLSSNASPSSTHTHTDTFLITFIFVCCGLSVARPHCQGCSVYVCVRERDASPNARSACLSVRNPHTLGLNVYIESAPAQNLRTYVQIITTRFASQKCTVLLLIDLTI